MEYDATLRWRMGLALAGLLLVDLLFVSVLAFLLAPWVGPLADALASSVGVPALAPALRWGLFALPALGLVVWAQLRFTRRTLLSRVDARPATRESHPGLLERMGRLSKLSDCETPAVAVVDSGVPNCFTVGGIGNATVVVSEGLLAELDDDQLDAVLAHELAHVVNRDAAVMTLASFLPTLVGDRPAGIVERAPGPLGSAVALLVGYPLAAAAIDAPMFSATYTGVYVALILVVALFGSVALGLLAVPATSLSRNLAKEREFAADRAAGLLTGNPAALAAALERLDANATTRPSEDARTSDDARASEGVPGSGSLPASERAHVSRDAHVSDVEAMCLLPHGFERSAGGDSRSAGTDGGQFVVSTRSHPPTDERIERLRTLAADVAA